MGSLAPAPKGSRPGPAPTRATLAANSARPTPRRLPSAQWPQNRAPLPLGSFHNGSTPTVRSFSPPGLEDQAEAAPSLRAPPSGKPTQTLCSTRRQKEASA